jgi:hypothetical protein
MFLARPGMIMLSLAPKCISLAPSTEAAVPDGRKIDDALARAIALQSISTSP